MTKCDLRNGMFGVMDDGEVFVVAADKLIFECGQYDDIAEMTDTMEFPNHYIDEVHEATCFKMVNEGRSKVIWKRPEPKVEEVESEEGKITITEEEFFEAVKAANELFFAIGNKTKPVRPEAEILMGLQNIAFGELVGAFLFGKETK